MTVSDELSKCAIVNRLREELESRGIEYRDDSSVMGGPPFCYKHVMLRTKWEHDGEEVSVIWGYFDLDDEERTWMTYGAPDRLECWYSPNDQDHIPMTLDEILETCA